MWLKPPTETEWRKAWWRHWGWETSFAGPGGNSANPEVWMSLLRGSWRLCSLHSLPLIAGVSLAPRSISGTKWSLFGLISEAFKSVNLLQGENKFNCILFKSSKLRQVNLKLRLVLWTVKPNLENKKKFHNFFSL